MLMNLELLGKVFFFKWQELVYTSGKRQPSEMEAFETQQSNPSNPSKL